MPALAGMGLLPTQARAASLQRRIYAIAQPSLADSGTPAAERQIVALPPIFGGCDMTCNDIEYFVERAIAEREMAKAAKHPNAVAAHEELALRYDTLIKGLTSFGNVVTVSQLAQAA